MYKVSYTLPAKNLRAKTEFNMYVDLAMNILSSYLQYVSIIYFDSLKLIIYKRHPLKVLDNLGAPSMKLLKQMQLNFQECIVSLQTRIYKGAAILLEG